MSPHYSRLGALLAVCVIVACVVFVVRKQSANRADGGAEVHPNRMLELMARYVVGVQGLMGGDKALGEWQSNFDEQLMQNVVKVSRGKADELRVLIVEGCVTHAWPEKEKFDALAAKDAELQADVLLDPIRLRLALEQVRNEAQQRAHGPDRDDQRAAQLGEEGQVRDQRGQDVLGLTGPQDLRAVRRSTG